MHVAATSSNQMKANEKSVARRRGAGVRGSRHIAIAVLVALGACKKSTDPVLVIETAPVERRSIVLSAQANGTVEPIDIVEVKSKASGTIIKMPVDIGSYVKVGDLLVQIDPRDCAESVRPGSGRRQLGDRRQIDIPVAAQSIEGSLQAADHYGTGDGDRDARLCQRRHGLDQGADESLDRESEARGRDGSRPDERHHYRTSGFRRDGNHVSHDLSEWWHDHSQNGRPDQGQDARVRQRDGHRQRQAGSDGYGDCRRVPESEIRRVVEKVEPEAVVQSSVTMFPVLVSLNNSDGALMPGMNGQVVMDILRRDNVLAVPSDAIRNARDAATVAPVLGVSADSIKAVIAAARQGRGGRAGTASSTAIGCGAYGPPPVRGSERAGGRWRWRSNRIIDGSAGRIFAPGRWRWRRRRGWRWSNRADGGGGGGMIAFAKKGDNYSRASGPSRNQRFRLHRGPEWLYRKANRWRCSDQQCCRRSATSFRRA